MYVRLFFKCVNLLPKSLKNDNGKLFFLNTSFLPCSRNQIFGYLEWAEKCVFIMQFWTSLFFIFCQFIGMYIWRLFKVLQCLRLQQVHAPLWKIIKYDKNLLKNVKKPCSTCLLTHFQDTPKNRNPGFRYIFDLTLVITYIFWILCTLWSICNKQWRNKRQNRSHSIKDTDFWAVRSSVWEREK